MTGPDLDVDRAEAAWALTGAISPRGLVRVAASDAGGRVLNSYPLVHPVGGRRPWTPWAVHLTDREGRFRLLCADLDARTTPEDVQRDLQQLAGVLDDLAIPHLVCRSGPSGGAHVWVGLAEGVDPDMVARLARMLEGWLPTADPTPLLNPSTGCVRPPGAPHRLGGTSTLVTGSLSELTSPRVTRGDVARLVEALALRVVQEAPSAAPRPTARPVAIDRLGFPHLPGTRRDLPPASRAALTTPVTGGVDASAVLWRVLCGAVAAHWRYGQMRGLLGEPGLEHARTQRHGAVRVPRPSSGAASPLGVLARQWRRAVQKMATLPASRAGEDPTFDGRAAHVTGVVRTVQERAEASAGRWRGPRGIAHRKVLDVICLFELQAVRLDVEADIRRIALTSGIDRETARRALISLASDGWLARSRPAAGPRAATWTTAHDGVIPRQVDPLLSQADPRPTHHGTAQRHLLLDLLGDRLTAAAHDVFAPRTGLGSEAGALYARLNLPRPILELDECLGWGPDQVEHTAALLAGAGLVQRAGRSWTRTSPSHLDEVAESLGMARRGEQRAAAYQIERQAWAWWLEELARLRATHRRLTNPPRLPHPHGHRPSRGTHPRRANGRAHFAESRRLCAPKQPPHTFQTLHTRRDGADRRDARLRQPP